MKQKDGCPAGQVMNGRTGRCDPRYRVEIIDKRSPFDVVEEINETNLQRGREWGGERKKGNLSFRIFDKNIQQYI